MIYYFSLGCVKTSVLLQYRRVFPTTAMRWTCYTLLALVGTYTIISVFIAGFDCAPVALFWDKSLSGKCINGLAFWFANAAFNILSDIAILIAPMPVLKSLNLGKKQKIALFGIFALGGLFVLLPDVFPTNLTCKQHNRSLHPTPQIPLHHLRLRRPNMGQRGRRDLVLPRSERGAHLRLPPRPATTRNALLLARLRVHRRQQLDLSHPDEQIPHQQDADICGVGFGPRGLSCSETRRGEGRGCYLREPGEHCRGGDGRGVGFDGLFRAEASDDRE